MRINEEKLNELNQLDRIEFRQRYDKIERDKPEYEIFIFMWKMFEIIGFVFLIGTILLSNGHIEAATLMFNIIPLICRLSIIAIVILFFAAIIALYFYSKKKGSLIKEYFDFKIETKHKKAGKR